MSQPIIPQPLPFLHPHLEDGQTYVNIHPGSLMAGIMIPSVFWFPQAIDVDRFKDAVAKVIGIWPIAASRYLDVPAKIGSGRRLGYDITPNAVPFSVQTLHRPDGAFPTPDVMQLEIGQYLEPLTTRFYLPNENAHLMTLRLTRLEPTGQSVLGLNWSHVLGDTETLLRFVSHLSQVYEEGSIEGIPLSDYPNFGPGVEWDPTCDEEFSSARALTELRSINGSADFDVSIRASMELSAIAQAIVIRVTRDEIAVFKEQLTDVLQDRHNVNALHLSSSDVVSAIYMVLMERSEVVSSIKTLGYAFDYRQMFPNDPRFPESLGKLASTVLGTPAIGIPSKITPDQTDLERMADFATSLRQDIIARRQDPDRLYEDLHFMHHWQHDVALQGKGHNVNFADALVYINSNLKYDFRIPFGPPSNKPSYHTCFVRPYSMRIYKGNPAEDSAEVSDVEFHFLLRKGTGQEERVKAAWTALRNSVFRTKSF